MAKSNGQSHPSVAAAAVAPASVPVPSSKNSSAVYGHTAARVSQQHHHHHHAAAAVYGAQQNYPVVHSQSSQIYGHHVVPAPAKRPPIMYHARSFESGLGWLHLSCYIVVIFLYGNISAYDGLSLIRRFGRQNRLSIQSHLRKVTHPNERHDTTSTSRYVHRRVGLVSKQEKIRHSSSFQTYPILLFPLFVICTYKPCILLMYYMNTHFFFFFNDDTFSYFVPLSVSTLFFSLFFYYLY